MGQLWPHPWMLPGFLESLFRDLSCLEMNCGVCQRRLQPSQHTEQGFAGIMGAGVAGDARPERAMLQQLCWAAPSASPGARAQAQFDGLEANRESLQLPLFLEGEYSMFLGKGTNPCSRDSGLWEKGDTAAPGACAGCCGWGEESPFCLWATLHRNRNCSRIRVKMREE